MMVQTLEVLDVLEDFKWQGAKRPAMRWEEMLKKPWAVRHVVVWFRIYDW